MLNTLKNIIIQKGNRKDCTELPMSIQIVMYTKWEDICLLAPFRRWVPWCQNSIWFCISKSISKDKQLGCQLCDANIFVVPVKIKNLYIIWKISAIFKLSWWVSYLQELMIIILKYILNILILVLSEMAEGTTFGWKEIKFTISFISASAKDFPSANMLQTILFILVETLMAHEGLLFFSFSANLNCAAFCIAILSVEYASFLPFRTFTSPFFSCLTWQRLC